MKKNKLGITEGDVKIRPISTSHYFGRMDIFTDEFEIAEVIGGFPYQQPNATLIADAFNTANKCGLLPSELLEQRDELMRVLKKALSISDLWTYGELICAEHICEARALDKMKLEFQNTINQIEQ